jgi:hypothetical protein
MSLALSQTTICHPGRSDLSMRVLDCHSMTLEELLVGIQSNNKVQVHRAKSARWYQVLDMHRLTTIAKEQVLLKEPTCKDCIIDNLLPWLSVTKVASYWPNLRSLYCPTLTLPHQPNLVVTMMNCNAFNGNNDLVRLAIQIYWDGACSMHDSAIAHKFNQGPSYNQPRVFWNNEWWNVSTGIYYS